MQLIVGSKTPVQDPSAEIVASSIRELAGTEDSFVILDSGTEDAGFIQTAGGPDLFHVEYRADAKGPQWGSVSDMPADEVIPLFLAFMRGDDSYRAAIRWEELGPPVWHDPLANERVRRPWLTGFEIVLLIIALVLALRLGCARFLGKGW